MSENEIDLHINPEKLKRIIEAALMAAGRPLPLDKLIQLFDDEHRPSANKLRNALAAINDECQYRGVELVEVASGFRFQAKQKYAHWVARLWEEKPAKYSRAMLETLSLIAYRQPITRGEIEEVRGVSVSSNIVKTLIERDWIRIVGHRDVPGRPALLATTKSFLDYFNLKSLDALPALSELKDLSTLNKEFQFDTDDESSDNKTDEHSQDSLGSEPEESLTEEGNGVSDAANNDQDKAEGIIDSEVLKAPETLEIAEQVLKNNDLSEE
jgi:segregation and condensation protein B